MKLTIRHATTALICALGACASLAPAASASAGVRHPARIHNSVARARAAIVNGGQIQITQAPWQVAIVTEVSKGQLLCGGSILNDHEIVTAGHCLFDPSTKTEVSPGAVTVIAGTANITESEIEHGATVQVEQLSGLRVHPYYEYAQGAGAPDDVGVLELASPLSFDEQVQPISLLALGAAPPEGTPATVTGFGQQNSKLPEDELLYSLGTTLTYRGLCSVEADAVFLCADTPTGSACFGDSGGPLSTGSPTALAGVIDIVELVNEECGAGALNGFVDVTAPEIREFIEGSTSPQMAPRGGTSIKVRAVPQVGHPMTCEAGMWTGAPTFTYAFIDSRNGQTLQAGPSPSYQLSASDVGRTIFCEVRASNAGGTGYQRTTSLRAVEAAAQTPSSPAGGGSQAPKSGPATVPSRLSLLATSISVQRNGTATVTLDCTGSANCTGKLTFSASAPVKSKGKRHGKARRTVTIGGASVIVAGSSITKVAVKLNGVGRALLTKDHGHVAGKLAIVQAGVAAHVQAVQLVEEKQHGVRGGK